jgi:fermentation-respiration switch protein FrsA (DUF1100 family)
MAWTVVAPDNMDIPLLEMSLRGVLGDTNTTLARQLMTWARFLDTFSYGPNPYQDGVGASAFYRQHGFVSYVSRLPEFRLPILLVAGAEDYLVPLGMMKQLFQLLGSSDKTFVEASRREGFQLDYGHGDLMVGLHAPREIYPVLLEWLVRRSGASSIAP